eukprot:scaffold1348_cov130-Isochrysis_galbana.AAC.2
MTMWRTSPDSRTSRKKSVWVISRVPLMRSGIALYNVIIVATPAAASQIGGSCGGPPGVPPSGSPFGAAPRPVLEEPCDLVPDMDELAPPCSALEPPASRLA